MITETAICYREPGTADGMKVWQLIRQAGSLDVNSPYCYIMLCDYFRRTCVVAEENGETVGFLSAYRAPDREDTLFIWQVAVANTHRGRGLGKTMIKTVLEREACRGVRYLETTVTPSNIASRRMFFGLAAELQTICESEQGYEERFFPQESRHEPERLFRIGPLA